MDALKPEVIADKVFELMKQFNHYIFAHPDILDEIPDRAVLVLLDPDDEAFNRANIELAKSSPYPPDTKIVYVRMTKHVRMVEQVEWMPTVLSAPLAA